jgi:hypothetical protein
MPSRFSARTFHRVAASHAITKPSRVEQAGMGATQRRSQLEAIRAELALVERDLAIAQGVSAA